MPEGVMKMYALCLLNSVFDQNANLFLWIPSFSHNTLRKWKKSINIMQEYIQNTCQHVPYGRNFGLRHVHFCMCHSHDAYLIKRSMVISTESCDDLQKGRPPTDKKKEKRRERRKKEKEKEKEKREENFVTCAETVPPTSNSPICGFTA